MNSKLLITLSSFSHFTDTKTLQACLEKASNPSQEKINSINDTALLLYELNSHISVKEVLAKIYEIEANIYILESALNGFDTYTYGEIEEFNTHFKSLNKRNKQSIKELCVMLDNKKFVQEKEDNEKA